MASPYNTRSTTSASSMTIEPQGQAQSIGTTTDIIVPNRHFCIALTNNPRMLRGAEQALRDTAAATAAATTTTVSTAHQRTTSETRQQAPLPPLPVAQQQQPRPHIRVLRHTSRVANEQQVVPISTQPIQGPTAGTERHTYEREIEEDFKVQIQPILQNYLNKTKRSPPVNLFLDMSTMIQY